MESIARDHAQTPLSRRNFLMTIASLAASGNKLPAATGLEKARVAITLDLEMSRHYPRRGMTEWDYQKGNLDQATKDYSVRVAKYVKERGGVVHFFCVGRVLEQTNVDWLVDIARMGHPVGNHTYDHVNVLARQPSETQFRFARAPWLVRGLTVQQILRENIALTNAALKERAGIQARGFRTPGGFYNGLADRPDIQQMLLDLGFTWVSSKYPNHDSGEPKVEPDKRIIDNIVAAQSAAQPFRYKTGLVEIPMSPISDVNAFRSKFWKREWFLNAIRQSVQWAIRTGGVFDFLCHPSCMVVEDPELETFQLICDLVEGGERQATYATLDQIAATVN